MSKQREILFKAKQLATHKEVEGSYIPSQLFNKYMKTSAFMYIHEGNGTHKLTQIDEKTVCQYTEIDAFWEDLISGENEQKLYEHDIIEIEYNDKKILTEVLYENGMYILGSDEFVNSYIPLFDIVELEEHPYVNAKIIGNSIDNPDLLKENTLYTIIGYSAESDLFLVLDSTFSKNDALNYADYLSIRVKEDDVIRNGHIITDIEVRKNCNKENEEIIYSTFNSLINNQEIDPLIAIDLKDVDTDLEYE